MKLKFAKDYITKNAIIFPDDALPQDKKNDPSYFLHCAHAIVAKFVNNKCLFHYNGPSDSNSIEELRAYASGNQSAEKYKDKLFGPKDNHGSRISTVNINMEPLKILAEKIDVVISYFEKIEYETITSAIDYQATATKETIVATNKLMTADKFRLMRDELNNITGVSVAQDPQMPDGFNTQIPFQNERQVDLFSSVGGIFLEQEAAVKILLDNTQYESNWSTLKKHILRDIVTLGIAGVRTVSTNDGKMVVKEYVDMNRAIIPSFKMDDSSDITWGGEIRKMSIAEIRRNSNISDIKLVELARKYATDGSFYHDAGFYSSAQQFMNQDNFDSTMIDQIEVDVADVCWIGTKSDNFTSIQRKGDNNTSFNKVGDEYEISKRDQKLGKTKTSYSRQVVYKAKLILGSDEVFDYGVDNYLSYKKDLHGRLNVVFPYKFSRTGTSSLVERCKGFIDDASESLFKLRIAKKKMPAPPNIIVRKSALEGVVIDKKVVSPAKLFKLFQDEGYLIVDDQNGWGNQVNGQKPIEVVPTDIIKQLSEWWLDIERNIAMIEKVTGVNDIFSAQTPSSETGLGVSRIAINATSNALFPIASTYKTLYEGTDRTSVYKWQVVAKYMTDKDRERLTIGRALKIIKISADLDKYDFAIKIQAGATEDEKLQLLQDITRLRDIRRQAGSGGITQSDFILVIDIIKNGNIKQAQLILAQIEEMRAMEDDRRDAQRIQQNMQSQMASNQQTAQNEAQLLQGKADLDLRNNAQQEQVKADLELRNEIEKAKLQRYETALQNVYGWSNNSYTKANK